MHQSLAGVALASDQNRIFDGLLPKYLPFFLLCAQLVNQSGEMNRVRGCWGEELIFFFYCCCNFSEFSSSSLCGNVPNSVLQQPARRVGITGTNVPVVEFSSSFL